MKGRVLLESQRNGQIYNIQHYTEDIHNILATYHNDPGEEITGYFAGPCAIAPTAELKNRGSEIQTLQQHKVGGAFWWRAELVVGIILQDGNELKPAIQR